MSFERPHFLLLTLITAAATFLSASSALSQSSKGSLKESEKEIRVIYEQLLNASISKEERSLREILADDYTQVTADGRIRTKEDRIKETLQQDSEGTKISLEDFRLRIYTDAAIALCRVKQAGRSEGKGYESVIVSTAMFIRQGGRWRIASTHLTFAKQ